MSHILDRTRTAAYNCANYAAEVWESEGLGDLRPVLCGFLTKGKVGEASAGAITALRRIPRAIEPCLVIMRSGKAVPHVGVFIRGRVQHLDVTAPIRQPLEIATIGYRSVRFYAPR